MIINESHYIEPEVNCHCLVLADQIQFTKCIQSIEVSEHHSATFECELSFDNAKVTWYKDSWELTESPKYNFRTEGRRHYMTICNVTAEDEGLLKNFPLKMPFTKSYTSDHTLSSFVYLLNNLYTI